MRREDIGWKCPTRGEMATRQGPRGRQRGGKEEAGKEGACGRIWGGRTWGEAPHQNGPGHSAAEEAACKYNLIKKIQKTSKIFSQYYDDISEIDIVGDIRHKGMLMGIELVSNKKKKTPIQTKKSINKVFFEEGKKNGIYLRTLGNIVMLVPPLSIEENELESLLKKTIKTIQAAKSHIIWLLTREFLMVNNYHIFINGIKELSTWVI